MKGLRAAIAAFISKKEEAPRHWYLFRSTEVADICSHFTQEEEAHVARMRRNHGFAVGLAISFPMLVFAMLSPGLNFWHLVITQLALQIAIAAIAFGWICERDKAFLASTKYAKSRGLTAASIRYYEGKRA
jgi:hypothetical protein